MSEFLSKTWWLAIEIGAMEGEKAILQERMTREHPQAVGSEYTEQMGAEVSVKCGGGCPWGVRHVLGDQVL